MKVRAIKDLTQLADPEFFAAVEEGLNLIVKNVTKLWDAAVILSEKKMSIPPVFWKSLQRKRQQRP